MISLKFFGLGGQGLVTAAKTLSVAVSIYEDKYAITVPSYGHERRGAPVFTSIIIDDEPVLLNCFVYNPDIVLISDISIPERGIDIASGIHETSILVLNTENPQKAMDLKENFGFNKVFYVAGSQIAINTFGKNIPNSAMIGALSNTGIVRIDSIEKAIEETFGRKIGPINALIAREAYYATKSL